MHLDKMQQHFARILFERSNYYIIPLNIPKRPSLVYGLEIHSYLYSYICISYCRNFLIGSILYTDNSAQFGIGVFGSIHPKQKKSAPSQQIGLFPQIRAEHETCFCCHEKKTQVVFGAEDRKRKKTHPSWSKKANLTLPTKKKNVRICFDPVSQADP